MAYFYIPLYLIGVFWGVPQISVDDVDMELEGNGALDIYDDAPIIAYLQVGEKSIGLTPKGRDHVVKRAKQFKWENNSLLQMWANG